MGVNEEKMLIAETSLHSIAHQTRSTYHSTYSLEFLAYHAPTRTDLDENVSLKPNVIALACSSISIQSVGGSFGHTIVVIRSSSSFEVTCKLT